MYSRKRQRKHTRRHTRRRRHRHRRTRRRSRTNMRSRSRRRYQRQSKRRNKRSQRKQRRQNRIQTAGAEEQPVSSEVDQLLRGYHIVTADQLSHVKIWKLATGECIQTLGGHTKAVNSVKCHPNGKIILSASDDNTVKI